MSEERITLEEAIDYIDSYLTEKSHYVTTPDSFGLKAKVKGTASRIAVTKSLKDQNSKDLDTKKNGIDEMFDQYRLTSGINKKDVKNGREQMADVVKSKPYYPKGGFPVEHHTAKQAEEYMKDTRGIILGKNKDEEISKLRKIKKKYIPESVDALRLRCYESCKAGLITEEERDVYLDYLDLDNYN